MKARGVAVAAAIARANKYFADSADGNLVERRMLKDFVSSWLMGIDQYRGYQYLYWHNQGAKDWLTDKQPSDNGSIPREYMYGPSDDDSRIILY